MPEATITCPEKLTFPQIAGMLYALEHVNVTISADFDYTYTANDRYYNLDVMLDTLRDAGFEPAQIGSIRFRPHEVTVDMWEWRDGHPFKRDDSGKVAKLTVHVPVEYPGREGLCGHFHTTREP
jgi:hypothetical protein